MNYEIVPIQKKHIQGFWEAIGIVAREKKYLAFIDAPPIEKTIAFIEENIKDDNAHFVVVVDDKVVGWCDVCPLNNRPTTTHVGVLGVGLLPEFRGKGIGRELMQKTIAKAKAKGLTRIELTVREKNLNAIALYKKLGFVTEGLKRNCSRIDGVYLNDYLMAILFEE